MTAAVLSRNQIRMMRHAIGLDGSGPPAGSASRGAGGAEGGVRVPRNLYVAGVSQLADWTALEAEGLAICVARRPHGLSVFRLTAAGIAATKRNA